MRDLEKEIVGIYKITNIVNGKVYVGQSVRLKKRHREHKSELNKNVHPNKHLQSAWNKYGEDTFNFEIIELCDKNLLDEKEVYWIDYYKSIDRKYGYNLDSGGCTNKTVSDETREKLKLINKGRIRSEETKTKISNTRIEKGISAGENNPRYGVQLSEETKAKISQSLIGREACNKGIPMSEEQKKKNSDSHKGKNMKLSKEQIVEIREKYTTGEYTHKQLKEEYSCGHATISYIINFKGAYKNVA